MRKSLKRSGKKVTAVTLAMLGCLSLPVFAEETKKDSTVTREVLVTASRTEQELKETPTTAEVITRAQIENTGAQTVQDALRMATNIQLPKGTVGGNELILRGMSSHHTLVLVDGRRMGGEDGSTLGGRYDLNRINISNVERIEIIRGAGSALYGADAMGGVVNIIMRKPEKEQIRLNMATGSDDQNLGFNFDTGQIGKWNWTMGVNFVKTRERGEVDLGRGVSILPNGSREYYNISGTYDMTEKDQLEIFFERMQERPSYSGPNVMGTAFTKDNYNGYKNSYGINYKGSSTKSNYELRAYLTELERRNNKYTNGITASGSDYRKYKNYVFDGKNSMQLGDNHLLTVGGEIRKLDYRGTNIKAGDIVGSITQNTGAVKNIRKKTTDYRSLYLQDEWIVNDKLLIIPALRYDYSSDFGDHYSPKVGMNYKFSDNYRLKANYGKGFRAPSITEIYYESASFLNNPDLKPEETEGYDISFEADMGKTSAKVTYFDNDVTNLISMKSLGGGIYQYQNVSEAAIKGMEFELKQKLSDKFDVKAVYTNLSAKNKQTNNKLTFRADDTYSIQLNYHDNKKNGIEAMLWYAFKDDYKKADNDLYSYGTLNFSINKKFNDKMSAFIGIDNIFDKKIDVLYEYGLSWRIGVNFTI